MSDAELFTAIYSDLELLVSIDGSVDFDSISDQFCLRERKDIFYIELVRRLSKSVGYSVLEDRANVWRGRD